MWIGGRRYIGRRSTDICTSLWCSSSTAQTRGPRPNKKWTPLHWASQAGHLGVARVLLEHDADASAKTKHKWTPLHWASERGHLDIALVLLEHGADPSAQNHKNWTPFQEASENGHRGTMQLLSEHGAVELGFDHHGIGGAA